MDRIEAGHRFLGEYDKDRVLRCIRCGQLPMQHYAEARRPTTSASTEEATGR